MSDERFDYGDDADDDDGGLVERSLDALHREKVPDGPSPDVTRRTLAALTTHAATGGGVVEQREQNERSTLSTRILAMTFTQRVAAAVMLTIGGLTVWFMLALFASVGYADVARQIREARSMTFTMTVTSPEEAQPEEWKFFALEPGMLRHEDSSGMVTITRWEGERGRALLLEPTLKTAHLAELNLKEAAAENSNPNMVAAFRGLADKPGEPLEDRQIGRVKAKGFRVVVDGGQTVSLWAHPKTGLPLLVEMPVPAGEAEEGEEGAKIVLSEIVFDEKLDEKLFSLEVPEGYKLVEEYGELMVKGPTDPEANVTNLLRAYTKATGGTFPEKLDDWQAYAKAFTGKGKTDWATIQAMSNAGQVGTFLSNGKPGEDYGYTGNGVKLGEKDTIVFWHRDKAKGTYRAVYADLSVKDVAAADLPTRK